MYFYTEQAKCKAESPFPTQALGVDRYTRYYSSVDGRFSSLDSRHRCQAHLQMPCRGIDEAPLLDSRSVINLRSILSPSSR